jgi:UDP-4-amino-4,6-dideoxy-N-acetyl-beta-L-altrosamine transaminase
MIPYGRQDINQDDINSVIEVLKSDFLTQGPQVPLFEKEMASYCGANFAVAVNSATSALHIACLALGVRKGDLVWTTPITFVATANCALYCGADVDFVDIDPLTYNLSVDYLEEKLVQAERKGLLPKVIIPVHFAGQPCDMVGIYALSEQYGFRIIEDASHAIGARYKNEAIGSCRYSDITVFSFHPVKIITTGEGGMAVTNESVLAKKMSLLRSHGITRNTTEMSQVSHGPWYYQQIDLGFNYRLTDLQAALGLSQLQRLDEFVVKRHAIANRYEYLLANLPVVTPLKHCDNYSSFHLYVIRLNLTQIEKTHREVFEALRDAGVGVNLHYIPVYCQPYYESLGFKLGYCPEGERYYNEAISLPMYPGLTLLQQEKVVAVLDSTINASSV